MTRKRHTIYTRSTNGYSLRKSKVLSIGGSHLKWSKSIERDSRKANEVSFFTEVSSDCLWKNYISTIENGADNYIIIFTYLYRKPPWLWLHLKRKKVKSILDKVILGQQAETIWHVSWFTISIYGQLFGKIILFLGRPPGSYSWISLGFVFLLYFEMLGCHCFSNF